MILNSKSNNNYNNHLSFKYCKCNNIKTIHIKFKQNKINIKKEISDKIELYSPLKFYEESDNIYF
jgi:hypothetical protein